MFHLMAMAAVDPSFANQVLVGNRTPLQLPRIVQTIIPLGLGSILPVVLSWHQKAYMFIVIILVKEETGTIVLLLIPSCGCLYLCWCTIFAETADHSMSVLMNLCA